MKNILNIFPTTRIGKDVDFSGLPSCVLTEITLFWLQEMYFVLVTVINQVQLEELFLFSRSVRV